MPMEELRVSIETGETQYNKQSGSKKKTTTAIEKKFTDPSPPKKKSKSDKSLRSSNNDNNSRSRRKSFDKSASKSSSTINGNISRSSSSSNRNSTKLNKKIATVIASTDINNNKNKTTVNKLIDQSPPKQKKSKSDKSLRSNTNSNNSGSRRKSFDKSVAKSSSTINEKNNNKELKRKATAATAIITAIALMTSTDTNNNNKNERVDRPKKDGVFLNGNEEEGQKDTVVLAENKDGVLTSGKKSLSSSSSLPCICWLIILLVVVIVALVIILPCYYLLIAPSSNGGNSNYPKISSESSDTVIGTMPVDICNERFPGEENCTPVESDDVRQGGSLCNLVAKSMINTTMSVDIALLNSGVCQNSLLQPELKAIDITNAIAANKLVVVEISGVDLVNILTEAVSSSFGDGPSSNPESYPYAAGLRYNVEANLMPSERISNVEVNRGLQDDTWEPIDIRRFYKVITTSSLADGSMGYYSFGNVIDSWKTPLNIETVDSFYNYVKTHEEDWWKLPDNEYSTQYFVDENEEPTLAIVPTRICHALIPGEPESELCSAADVVHGGEVCNLVAWALYDQIFGVDFVLLKGDTCSGDIEEGQFGQSDVDQALSFDQSLVTIDILGSVIKSLIEEAVSAVIEYDTKGAYPYFAGLRFDVDTNSSQGDRVSNVKIITPSGSWIPVNDTDSYTMLTTITVAQGEDPSYATISQADMSTMENNDISLKDKFITYAIEWGFLYPLPEEKISTQSYV